MSLSPGLLQKQHFISEGYQPPTETHPNLRHRKVNTPLAYPKREQGISFHSLSGNRRSVLSLSQLIAEIVTNDDFGSWGILEIIKEHREMSGE